MQSSTSYLSHPQWQLMLAAIRSQPDDDLVRLVAADWLDELETEEAAERAEFIRVQCELAKTPELVWRNKLIHRAEWDAIRQRAEPWGERFELASPSDAVGVYHYRETNPVHVKLYGRTSALADGIYGPLLGPVALAGGTWTVERGFTCRVSAPLAVLNGGECGRCGGVGHLDLYSCPGCYLSPVGTGRTPGVLGELLRREPITAAGIEVTDREPWPNSANGQNLWLLTTRPSTEIPDPARLPLELFNLIQPDRTRVTAAFPTADAARLAIGEALCRLHSPKSEVLT